MMTTQILVPLDGSALAERALSCAAMLAKALPADLVLFRAVSISPDYEILGHTLHNVEAHMERLDAEANDYLGQVAGRLRTAGVAVHTVVRRGPAAEAIVDYAEQMDIQQIVMSTHGYSGISRWRHGSVAERVLQSAGVPVLMICATGGEAMSQEPMTCQRILVPLDGSDRAEQVLPPAVSVARALDAEIVLFRVPIAHVSGGSYASDWYVPLEGTFESANHIAEKYLNRVADELRVQGVRVSTGTQMGGVADAILEYADANKIDLIAMCTHGRTGLARWTLGSVADRVLRASSLPLLLVRAR
jgi:nucleotide-binding universal stress UspA family protein